MVTHGIHQTKGTGTVILVQDGLVWFRTGEGRLKFPLRMLPNAEVNMHIRFVQRGDVIQKIERLS